MNGLFWVTSLNGILNACILHARGEIPIFIEKMATLQIRKLPAHIYEALKASAEKERRSLSQQAIIALAKGLDLLTDYRDRRKEVLAEIKADWGRWDHFADVDVTQWIREDRSR